MPLVACLATFQPVNVAIGITKTNKGINTKANNSNNSLISSVDSPFCKMISGAISP